MKKANRGKIRTLKPKEFEKILNYNGFYATNQNNGKITFNDDLGREITIGRGDISPSVWKRLKEEYDLVPPSKTF